MVSPIPGFGQLTQRDSLRDNVTCLNAHPEKRYHMGLTKGVKRSTLADANEERDYQIYEALAKSLISKARALYQGELERIDLNNALYALDSTTIELCLDVFWWAKFRKHKAAPPDKAFLGRKSKRCKNSNIDCRMYFCNGGYFEAKAKTQHSVNEMLQLFSVSALDKSHINQLF